MAAHREPTPHGEAVQELDRPRGTVRQVLVDPTGGRRCIGESPYTCAPDPITPAEQVRLYAPHLTGSPS